MKTIGRPTKLKAPTVQKLLEAFKLGCSIEEACLYADIGKTTYYDWLKQNEDFSERIELSKKYLELKSRANIANSIESGNVKTAMWYLERRNKSEFSLKQEIETKQNIEISSLNSEDIKNMSQNEIDEMRKRLLDN